MFEKNGWSVYKCEFFLWTGENLPTAPNFIALTLGWIMRLNIADTETLMVLVPNICWDHAIASMTVSASKVCGQSIL